MSSSECESQESYYEEISNEENTDSDTEEINDLISNFLPYCFEPEKESSSGSDTEESSENNDDDSSDDELSPNSEIKRAGHKNWCVCGNCKKELREIDSLCCQEVAAIPEENFEGNQCITMSEQFQTLCLNKIVLKNVLVGLHESKGDPLEKDEVKNRSLRYAAYKQFVWWIYQRLGKGNRRVLPSCVLWKVRKLFPEGNGQYTLYSEGEKD